MSVWGMIHATSALFILFTIFLPFVLMGMKNMQSQQVAARAGRFVGFLRILNFMLIVSLGTGVYQSGVLITAIINGWLLGVFALFLAIGAFLGIIQKALKQVKESAEQGQSYEAPLKKALTLSYLLAVADIVMIVLKVM